MFVKLLLYSDVSAWFNINQIIVVVEDSHHEKNYCRVYTNEPLNEGEQTGWIIKMSVQEVMTKIEEAQNKKRED